MLASEVGMVPAGVAHVLNYGSDKVRFLNPVKVGSRVRLRMELIEANEKRPGQHLIKTRNTIEIEGTDKPAMVAENSIAALPGLGRLSRRSTGVHHASLSLR